VRFGIFFEHQLARPWGDDGERQLIQDALDQVELADKLGIQYVWEVEHHFLEEYSHSSAPEVFLAAASQRTRNIRLGHGIVQTAPQYNHPFRVAERLATLDLVSNGRVEFGSGESSSEAELNGFGVPLERKRQAWLEGLQATLRCMTETPFTGLQGEFVSMPPRNVVPKPVQKPHPPLWVACSRRETILLAAEKGLGALSFSFVDPEEAATWVTDHRRRMAEACVPVGQAVNHDIACVTPMMCHADEDEALARGLEGANFFGYSLAHYYVFGDHVPGRTNVWEEFVQRRDRQGYSPAAAVAAHRETLGAKVASGDVTGLRGAVGTPGQLREYLRRYEEAGVDQVIFVMQTGRTRHEHIMEGIELFAREVLPEFAERDDDVRKAKAELFAPIVEAAFARKAGDLAEAGPPPPPLPPGYTIKALPKALAELSEDRETERWMEKLADNQAAGVDDPELRGTILGG
jgi:alkanesulfonate monooxygenase SsuD/methylene tetrahydromethanopterin reductase-like flavin-dependent oxidoreductase (luciferase family)